MSKEPDHIRVPVTKCAHCGHKINAVGASDGEAAQPQPGDPIACIKCGVFSTIGDDGQLRAFTADELDRLAKDPDWWRALLQLKQRIHEMNAEMN